MEKVWLKSYPKDVPAEINPDVYQSLPALFEDVFHQFSQLPAFYNLGTTLTYSQIEVYSRAFAAYLQQHLKLKKGDRIAVMLPNVLQYPIVVLGALRLGLIVVNVNPLYTVSELTHQLKDSGAETIVVLEHAAHTVQQALANATLKNVIVTRLGDMLSLPKGLLVNFIVKHIKKTVANWNIPTALQFNHVLSEGQKAVFEPVALSNNDIAFLQYTGGTTGISKGAILTHRNLIANVLQAEVWFKPIFIPGKEIMVTALPLYHIFSLTANCLLVMKFGGLNLLITNPRDTAQMIAEIVKFKFTTMTGVNTLFNALLKSSQFAKLNFQSLKYVLGGGMAVQRVVAEKWQTVTGTPLTEAYGLTETSPCVAINPVTVKDYNGSVGLPVSSTDVCILDDAQKEVPIGQPGELAVKGPQVMRGYWGKPLETQKVFTKDGWLLTGDIASIDAQGFVRILERKKDMILVSGFNVYPNEVEGVLASMPGVREVAVVAVPNETSGEAPKAFIVRDDPHLTVQAVIAFCHTQLAGYKVPRQVEFCDVLPKTNVGKVLRRQLREISPTKE